MNHLQRRIAPAAALLLAACAGAPAPGVPSPSAAALPAAIAAAPSHVLKRSVAARGVQIYECRAMPASGRHEWVFVAPEAALFDESGRLVGHHGAGPHWTFDDGTRVTGRVTGRADAPLAGAIPWLRLESPAPMPSAPPPRDGDLRSIQRIHTQGGVAPAEPCAGSEAGRRARVPYTADYLFYGER